MGFSLRLELLPAAKRALESPEAASKVEQGLRLGFGLGLGLGEGMGDWLEMRQPHANGLAPPKCKHLSKWRQVR